MSDYFFEEAARQYENQIEERYSKRPVCECENCGCGIYAGEYYWDVFDNRICESCMQDMRMTAEEEDYEL